MASKSATKDSSGPGKLDDTESEAGDPRVSSFQSLAAEGDILAKQGDYRKAIDAYTKVHLCDDCNVHRIRDTGRLILFSLGLVIAILGPEPTPKRQERSRRPIQMPFASGQRFIGFGGRQFCFERGW